MKTVRDIIRRSPVWVNPEHTAETAVILLRGYEFGGLPVLDGRELVGMLQYGPLLGATGEELVRDLMDPDTPVLNPDMTARQVASLMMTSGCHRLPVVDEGKLIGVVACGDVLPEVSRSFDPLTGLPWSDSLRAWAIEQFISGQEITVLFIDLNKFGQFNKQYSHLVGDEVLRSVARTLLAVTDPEIDYACRYGGDEFCVASLRNAESAAELGDRISRAVTDIEISGTAGERVSCSVGRAGGKRTREREHVHFAATLDNLITLASKDCIANKTVAVAKATRGEAEVGRMRLTRVDVTWSGSTATVHVNLQLVGTAPDGDPKTARALSFQQVRSADTDEEGVLRLVADTAAGTLKDFLPGGYDMEVTDVLLNTTTDLTHVVTVVGQYSTPSYSMPVAGSAVISTDRYRATAGAVLASVNRLLGRIPVRPTA